MDWYTNTSPSHFILNSPHLTSPHFILTSLLLTSLHLTLSSLHHTLPHFTLPNPHLTSPHLTTLYLKSFSPHSHLIIILLPSPHLTLSPLTTPPLTAPHHPGEECWWGYEVRGGENEVRCGEVRMKQGNNSTMWYTHPTILCIQIYTYIYI